MGPMSRLVGIGHGPSDVPEELFVERIVSEAVGEVHGDVQREREGGEFRAHASVGQGFFRAGVILDHEPGAQELEMFSHDKI